MPIILDKELYNIVKLQADKIYKKSSAYKSMYIQKRYKELGVDTKMMVRKKN